MRSMPSRIAMALRTSTAPTTRANDGSIAVIPACRARRHISWHSSVDRAPDSSSRSLMRRRNDPMSFSSLAWWTGVALLPHARHHPPQNQTQDSDPEQHPPEEPHLGGRVEDDSDDEPDDDE